MAREWNRPRRPMHPFPSAGGGRQLLTVSINVIMAANSLAGSGGVWLGSVDQGPFQNLAEGRKTATATAFERS